MAATITKNHLKFGINWIEIESLTRKQTTKIWKRWQKSQLINVALVGDGRILSTHRIEFVMCRFIRWIWWVFALAHIAYAHMDYNGMLITFDMAWNLLDMQKFIWHDKQSVAAIEQQWSSTASSIDGVVCVLFLINGGFYRDEHICDIKRVIRTVFSSQQNRNVCKLDANMNDVDAQPRHLHHPHATRVQRRAPFFKYLFAMSFEAFLTTVFFFVHLKPFSYFLFLFSFYLAAARVATFSLYSLRFTSDLRLCACLSVVFA